MKPCRKCGREHYKIRPSRIKRRDWICQKCSKKPYWIHKGKYCIKCGPDVKYHLVQLDVDHIDGNNKNNSKENLQTLCANCHRLKTMEFEDHL